MLCLTFHYTKLYCKKQGKNVLTPLALSIITQYGIHWGVLNTFDWPFRLGNVPLSNTTAYPSLSRMTSTWLSCDVVSLKVTSALQSAKRTQLLGTESAEENGRGERQENLFARN